MRRHPRLTSLGAQSAGASDDVSYQQTEAAYDFAALLDRLDSEDKLQLPVPHPCLLGVQAREAAASSGILTAVMLDQRGNCTQTRALS